MSDLYDKWLKKHGCIVVCQDNKKFFMKEGFWGVIYIKDRKNAKIQKSYKEELAKLDEWSWAKVVWGGKDSNWEETKEELSDILR